MVEAHRERVAEARFIARPDPYDGGPKLHQPGVMGRCRICGKAVQLVRSRNPDTGADHDFWVHYAARVVPDLIETHKAVLSPGVV